MCVSAIVETELERIAARLNLTRLDDVTTWHERPASAFEAPPKRIEAHDPAVIIRQGNGGRLVAERMAFNSYVLHRASLGGDMWAERMLSHQHGLLVLKSFSEWVNLGMLLGQGLVPLHEANCAFNRFAAPSQRFGSGRENRQVLANFNPASGGSLLVPVLFDLRQRQEVGALTHEFAIISDDPHPAMRPFGTEISPVCLSYEGAMEWMHVQGAGTEPSEDGEDPGAEPAWNEILADGRPEVCSFNLFKSA